MVNRTIANNLNLDGIPINTSGAYPIKSQRIILAERAPTVNDKSPQYNIGTIWVVLNRGNADPDKYQYWYLADNALAQPGNIANATWLRFAAGSGPFASQITTTLDGNVAIPIAHNWNFVSLAPVEVRTPINGQQNITFGVTGAVATTYTTDSGNAIPALGVLNVLGGDNINTAAIAPNSNNLYVNLDKSLHMPSTIADGTQGVWYTGATGFPLAGGQIFISNLGTANTFVGEDAGNLTLTTGSAVENSGFGSGALTFLTTGSGNSSLGFNSSLSLESGTFNLSAGHSSLALLEDGDNNVALGNNALASSVSDSEIVAIGAGALQDADGVTGSVAIGFNSQNAVSTGSRNTTVGHSTMEAASTASDNCMYGFEAGKSVTTASRGIFVGKGAGSSLTTKNEVIAIGVDALGSFVADTGGTFSPPIAIGYQAMFSAETQLTDTGAIAIGYQALYSNQVADRANIAIGTRALSDLNNGLGGTGIYGNTAIGDGSMQGFVTGVENTAVGSKTMWRDSSSGTYPSSTGSFNTVVGEEAMGNPAAAAITGNDNVAIGNNSCYNLTTGSFNTVVGSDSALSLTTGSGVTAVGYQALENATTGVNVATATAIGYRALRATTNTDCASTAIGRLALTAMTSGIENTALGHASLTILTTGDRNCGFGEQGGNKITTGSRNTAVGAYTMANNSGGIELTGNYNICLGHHAGYNFASTESSNIIIQADNIVGSGFSNTTVIGGGTGTGDAQQNRCFISGIRGITTGVADAINVLIDSAGQLGTISSSIRYKDDVKDIESVQSHDIYNLRPVSFVYKSDESKTVSYGLIAEEVEKVMPDMVVYDLEGRPETIRYHLLMFHMLKELQHLRKEVDDLRSECTCCTAKFS